ncbi:MAG: B-box zinc finger protein [Acidobacteria bacterium]|nr:B-box zinc finger protein [Acidobacteriota bacterium]
MNCLNHPETPAVAYCRTCGKPLCAQCKQTAQGVIYCSEHAPAQPEPESPYTAPAQTAHAHPECSPALACLLGFIPGVGAIYNGQYAKGLVHAVIFGLLISIAESGAGGLGPMFGILIAVWFFYMAIEAYHTCSKRRAGEPVDEFSSLVNLHGRSGTFPTAAVALIALGVILLMDTMGLLRFREIARYWPVLLILAGVYMLYLRIGAGNGEGEVRNERH